MKNKQLTHINQRGEARMVDVGRKRATERKAVAEGWISMNAETLARLESGAHKKGDVLAVARVAGIMGAKRTAELVPLCHPIMLTHISVEFSVNSAADDANSAIHCTATVATTERTGVEMEALSAVQTALLTIYDMCKSVERGMEINQVRLLHKSGGKSGEWNRAVEVLPIKNENGAITNAIDLHADAVVGKKIVCPVCDVFEYQRWSFGWDAHAKYRCEGLCENDPEKRKDEYKDKTAHLFMGYEDGHE